MNKYQFTYFFIVLFSAIEISTAKTIDIQCEINQETMTQEVLSIVYLNKEKPIPCLINLTKNQQTTELWTANYEIGFCEKKINQLLNNFHNKGYKCNRVNTLDESEEQTIN